MKREHRKAKILEISRGEFGTGGAGVILWSLYQNMNKNNVLVDFYCTKQPESRYAQEILKNGGNYWIQKAFGNKIIRKIVEYCYIKEIAKKGCYDCIHINASNAYFALHIFLASKKYVNKVICHSHSTNLTGGAVQRAAHKLSKKMLCNRKIIPLACSKDAAKWLFPLPVIESTQYKVIKNGIDTRMFLFDAEIRSSIRKQLRIENRFVIGHVGRFAYEKNHEFLIDIFAELKKRCPSAVLLLIGGDSGENLIDGIKEKVNSLGLSESVIFYGNTDKVNELYQAMDCFVFPSRYEGLGIVAIEAQAAGLKILCSDGVPQEAKITDLLEYMPLSDGAEKWAEKILTYNDGYERKNMEQRIKDAGYDIRMSAKELENIYLSCRKENDHFQNS